MSSITVASIAFLCIFGGALFGLFLSRALPQHHRSNESKRSPMGRRTWSDLSLVVRERVTLEEHK